MTSTVAGTTCKAPGDVAELGDILGHPMEPYARWARIVGFRKDDCPAMERIIIRLFANPDERWPSGEYRTTPWIVAWEGKP